MGKLKNDLKIDPPYLALEHYMMKTAAWTALSDRAIWLYLELRMQFNKKQGGNDHLSLPYSRVKWRMSTTSYCKGMQELVHYGFIRVVQPGGLPHRATVYGLSENWREISIKIGEEEGRDAVRLGLVSKPHSRNNLKNLEGHRTWERA